MRNRWLLAVLPFLCSISAQALDLGPCPDVDLPAGARCGTYEVFENRTAGTGRKIALRVAVVPALEPANRLPDPLVLIGGGPGESIIDSGSAGDDDISVLRRRRDILMVDFRGTGGSAPLPCTEIEGVAGIQKFLDSYLPVADVRACRKRLEPTVGLAFYNADMAVDDLAEVATVLGYQKLNLIGWSYGTRVELVFLRRHPGLVRTATLFGVLPTDGRVPLPAARNSQNSFNALVALCAADPACRAAFPDPEADLETVLRQVDRKPARINHTDPKTGQVTPVDLSRAGVVQTVRYMLYGTIGQTRLPLALRRAAQGDFQPLGDYGMLIAAEITSGVEALVLSSTCAEDVPFIQERETREAVRGTFLGDFRIRAQIAACAEWPPVSLGSSFLAPVISDVPVLLFSGEIDPTTPPDNGEEVVRHLSRGRHLVIPGAGHSLFGMKGIECVHDLMTTFVNAADAGGLDVSCLPEVRRPPFVLQ